MQKIVYWVKRMQRKKILLVAYNNLELGGIQNVIMNIVRNLSDEFLFDIVCFDSERTYFDDEFESFGGKIFRVGKKRRTSFIKRIAFYLHGRRLQSAIKNVIKENGPYIAVHSHKEVESGYILKAAKKCGVPVRIAHAHTAFDNKYHPLAKIYISHLKKLIYKNATDLVACSKKAGEKLFGERNYQIIYNTVDKKFLEFDSERKISNAPVLLQVGMVCDNKNQLFSVEVLVDLKKRYPDAKLTFIGEPKDDNMQKYFDNLIEKSKQLGVFDSVSFLPADSDVLDEMKTSDYVIFPSKFEGLGVVPIETQAQGLKCFVSNSVSGEVDCGGCEFLNLNDGAEVWAAKISEQFEKDYGQRVKYDMARFLPDTVMTQYRKLYNGESD